jgi:hypothetical protein
VASRAAPDPDDAAARTAPAAAGPAERTPPAGGAEKSPDGASAEAQAAVPDPTRGGGFDTQRFLANLDQVQGDRHLAQENPELWRVVQAVRRQIRTCWRLPDASLAGRSLAVDLRVAFDRNGGLTRADVVDVGRTVQDDRFRRVADSAKRALAACSPFELPAESYALWDRFTMRFVPDP